MLCLVCLASAAHAQSFEPLTRTLEWQGVERTYYVSLPRDYDPEKTYWGLVVVHGGGGGARTNPKAIAMRRFADELGLPAILILPEFITEDKQVSRFPSLGEEAFLKEVLKRVRAEYKLHEKILLNGYSMGGQFSHRFAMANPDMVQACAPFAAGTWTTPDGRLLIEEYGEVKDPKAFLSNRENAAKIPERLRDLFDPRTAGVAGLKAVAVRSIRVMASPFGLLPAYKNRVSPSRRNGRRRRTDRVQTSIRPNSRSIRNTRFVSSSAIRKMRREVVSIRLLMRTRRHPAPRPTVASATPRVCPALCRLDSFFRRGHRSG